ncbi:unnamed protein product [Medioppia subpectinata]|uniref:Uncharacterized protein n=1 Tax=Medioppia subpectinata TaxID=1979941 RepID=A0A7R9KWR4_9ACAR|nr:unnamed protein product [Medioppia subpectinata]CAG2111260.1 unnamed protein product [Medioppia subpectinata]
MALQRCCLLHIILCICIVMNLIMTVYCGPDTANKTKQAKPKRQPNNLRQSPTSKNVNTGAAKCGKEAYREMDGMVAQYSSSNDRFPESIKELQARCLKRKEVLPKMEDLKNRCMDGLAKRVVAVVIYSMKRQRKIMCRKKPNKRMLEMAGAGKCINSFRPAAQNCVEEAMDHVIGIRNSTDNKMKIPFLCCTFVKMKACILETGHRSKQCSEEHLSLLVRQSEQVSNGPMNMACGDYNEESDKCDKIQVPRRLANETLPKSFVMPMIDLMESLGAE